jgi:AcrR family transcriptional regulator
MERSKRQNGDLRRLILDTTRHLLVQEGYQNLSMRKIARAIDYSATSIYLHFDSKDALLHALIDEGMTRLYDQLRATADDHPDDPVERLEALCRQFITFGLENPEYYEVMFLLHPERMERYPAEKYRRARRNLDVIAATLSAGVRKGVFRVEDPRVSASTIWASLHGAVSLILAERIDVRIEGDAFIESMIQQAIQGYIRTEPQASG